MSKFPKLAVVGAFVLFALSAYVWSALAVYVTLAGTEERALIDGGALEYVKRFAWYLFGPVFPSVSMVSWLATAAIGMAIAVSIGMGRRGS